MKINWTLQEKQALANSCPAREILYGGAAGGGKTDWLLYEALQMAVLVPKSKSLILRRTYPELEQEIIPRSKQKFVYEDNKGIGRYLKGDRTWIFPWGSSILIRSCQHEKDIENFQGGEFDFVGIDELTKFTSYMYNYIKSRARSTIEGSIPRIRATANPGGIGHGWVKQYFNVADKSMKIMIDSETGLSRCFIPSRLYDNHILMAKDPLYEKNLLSLPSKLRKALLEGDWDVFSGQVFEEWRNNPNPANTHTHIIKSFEPPIDWRRYRSFDFGYTKPFAVGWYAVDYDGRIYKYRELYGCTNTPNEGVKWHPRQIAQKIKEIENQFEQGNKIFGVADPSIYDKSRGESVADQMAEEGIYFNPGNNSRMAGKMQVHYRLAFDENGIPMMYITENCIHTIRTMPDLVYDKTNVEDVDTDCEEHQYDELRYILQERPIGPRVNHRKLIEDVFNPLNQRGVK